MKISCLFLESLLYLCYLLPACIVLPSYTNAAFTVRFNIIRKPIPALKAIRIVEPYAVQFIKLPGRTATTLPPVGAIP